MIYKALKRGEYVTYQPENKDNRPYRVAETVRFEELDSEDRYVFRRPDGTRLVLSSPEFIFQKNEPKRQRRYYIH